MEQRKYIYIKGNSVADFFIHTGIVLSLIFVIGLLFFNAYLPGITYHRETVTVPDLKGMSVAEVEKFLRSRDLDFAIRDSSYSKSHKPYIVLSQSPLPGEKVKRYRKLILIVNPKYPPKVKVPYLRDVPFTDALRMLKNMDLELGRIKYEPHVAENAVLEQSINGKKLSKEELDAGYLVPKGTKIDLLLADGRGEKEFPVPDLVMMPLDEAEFVIKGHGLQIGSINYDYNSSREVGTVLRQVPPVRIGKIRDGVKPNSSMDEREKSKVREGDLIDLWVSGNPAAKPLSDEEAEKERKLRDSLDAPSNIRSGEYFKEYLNKKKGTVPKPQQQTPKPNNENKQ